MADRCTVLIPCSTWREKLGEEGEKKVTVLSGEYSRDIFASRTTASIIGLSQHSHIKLVCPGWCRQTLRQQVYFSGDSRKEVENTVYKKQCGWAE